MMHSQCVLLLALGVGVGVGVRSLYDFLSLLWSVIHLLLICIELLNLTCNAHSSRTEIFSYAWTKPIIVFHSFEQNGLFVRSTTHTLLGRKKQQQWIGRGQNSRKKTYRQHKVNFHRKLLTQFWFSFANTLFCQLECIHSRLYMRSYAHLASFFFYSWRAFCNWIKE